MALKDEIQRAVGAHGMWKQRLIKAVAEAQNDAASAKASLGNDCDFGKWLHGLPPTEKSSEHWKKVQALHEEFHVEAARILELAVTGRSVEASAGMAPGGKFAVLSAQMTTAMMTWARA